MRCMGSTRGIWIAWCSCGGCECSAVGVAENGGAFAKCGGIRQFRLAWRSHCVHGGAWEWRCGVGGFKENGGALKIVTCSSMRLACMALLALVLAHV